MIRISFFMYSTKPDKHGKAPVNAKIFRSEEDKATIYTKLRIAPEHWDGVRVLEGEMLHHHYNAILDTMKAELLKSYLDDITLSCQAIKAKYENKFKRKLTVSEIVTAYVEQKLALVKNDDTRRTYLTHKKALVDYLRLVQLHCIEAGLFGFREARILYQKILPFKSVIYSNKIIRLLKASLLWGYGEKLCEAYLLEGFKLKAVPHKKITSKDYLNLDEIVRLVSANVPEKYYRAKCLATLQIFTGMAFADVTSFNPKTLQEIQGQLTLVGDRVKSGNEYIVPLNVVALGVIESYDMWADKKIENCTYNEHLKVLAAYAGIAKNVTTHMLRRTFAQNMLDGGISAEVVAKMLGHVDTRMLRFYATVSSVRVIDEVEAKMAA